jgi:hypothetical protein
MAIVDLSGTPVVRYPDPPVPRVLPNGVQPYSAYEAPMVYLSGTKGTPAVVCNIVLVGLPNFGAQLFALLFGTDYPASVIPVEYMSGVILDSTGAPLPITDPSFVGLPWIGTNFAATSIFSSLIPSTETFADIRYKQIVRGLTVTNGVAVSGFPVAGVYDTYGLLGDEAQTVAPSTQYSLRVLMNGAVINSSSPFIGQTYRPAPTDLTLPTSLPNYPIILWEGDFTQAIVDSGFKIAGNVLIAGDLLPATLDVVGLWSSPDYSP